MGERCPGYMRGQAASVSLCVPPLGVEAANRIPHNEVLHVSCITRGES